MKKNLLILTSVLCLLTSDSRAAFSSIQDNPFTTNSPTVVTQIVDARATLAAQNATNKFKTDLAAGTVPVLASALTGTAAVNTTGNAATATTATGISGAAVTAVNNIAAANAADYATNGAGLWIGATRYHYGGFTNCVFVDATNGNNANHGYSMALPKQTPQAACAVATNGQTIVLAKGLYVLGTNILVLPANVNLIGSGIDETVLTGFADCSGVEQAFSATGGPQINPGTNSLIADFTMVCDTNTVDVMAGASTHSGTSSAVGVSYLNPPSDRTFENVTFRNLRLLYWPFDAFHFNSRTNLSNIRIENCEVICSGNAFNSVPYLGSLDNRASYFVKDSNFHTDGVFPANVFPLVSDVFVGDGSLVVENCQLKTTQSGASIIGSGYTSVQIRGGSFNNSDTADRFFDQSVISGWFRYNGTNFNNYVLQTNANPQLNTIYTNGVHPADFYASVVLNPDGTDCGVRVVTYRQGGTQTNFWSESYADDPGAAYWLPRVSLTAPLNPNDVFYVQTFGSSSPQSIVTNCWKIVIRQ